MTALKTTGLFLLVPLFLVALVFAVIVVFVANGCAGVYYEFFNGDEFGV